MKSEIVTIPESDDGVAVVILKRVQKLREDRQIAGSVFVLYESRERRKCEQEIEIVRHSAIERFSFFKTLDLSDIVAKRLGEGMATAEVASDLDDALVYVISERLQGRTANLSSTFSVIAEEQRQASGHQ